MLTMMLLAVALTGQDASHRHVRASEPRILALLEIGLSRSATFRNLVATLDASDVIVYVEPKLTRQNLGGYLAHRIVARGGYRYLRIAIEMQGAEGRSVPLLAHELQHAVEIAQTPEAIDAESLEQAFVRLAVRFGCSRASCYETQAAQDVQQIVGDELKATSVIARRN